MRGRWNSSITRVRPFFRALFARDPTGASWLGPLLAACPLVNTVLPRALVENPGTLQPALLRTRPVRDKILGPIDLEEAFEYSVPPTSEFLAYLLSHPSALSWPEKRGTRVAFGHRTQTRREALIDGDPQEQSAAMAEGLDLLRRKGAAGSRRQWWAFEGFTEVDCLLQTDRLVLFVEGKRTELLSESTSWFRGRNQLVRNLEAVRDMAQGRHAALLVACERAFADPPASVFDTGLPHLTEAERVAIQQGYLGQVTWARLCDATGLDVAILPTERAAPP